MSRKVVFFSLKKKQENLIELSKRFQTHVHIIELHQVRCLFSHEIFHI